MRSDSPESARVFGIRPEATHNGKDYDMSARWTHAHNGAGTGHRASRRAVPAVPVGHAGMWTTAATIGAVLAHVVGIIR